MPSKSEFLTASIFPESFFAKSREQTQVKLSSANTGTCWYVIDVANPKCTY